MARDPMVAVFASVIVFVLLLWPESAIDNRSSFSKKTAVRPQTHNLVTPAIARAEPANQSIHVLMQTNLGDLSIELYPDLAPASVSNFLSRVDAGEYNGTIFNLVNAQVALGGTFREGFNPIRNTMQPRIDNESMNGLKNIRGTLATFSDPHLPVQPSNFYINLSDNPEFDYPADNNSLTKLGLSVFGRVVGDNTVLNRIAQVPTGDFTIPGDDVTMPDVPLEPVIVLGIQRL